MNVLCLVLRHKWRVVERKGDEPYEVCARCGHYRNQGGRYGIGEGIPPVNHGPVGGDGGGGAGW